MVSRAVLLVLVVLPTPVSAQVIRDGSIGPGGPGLVAGGIDDLGQPATYLIHEGLGERAGTDLFHSFDQFSVGSGETATFTATQPTDKERRTEGEYAPTLASRNSSAKSTGRGWKADAARAQVGLQE